MALAASTPDYILPNGSSEWERLDYQHRLLVRMFGGLHRAPLDPTKIKRVLDVGCGTGQWAMDFATRYPDAEVIGFDITDKPSWKTAPANCSFRVANLELDETWEDLGHFDFIHGRFIVPSVKDWPRLVQKCHEHLEPGGFIECQDISVPSRCMETDIDPATSKLLQWGVYTKEGWERCGLQPNQDELIADQLSDLGFEDITLEDFKMMFGPWADDAEEKELGFMGQQNFLWGVRGFAETIFVKYLGWTQEELDEFLEEFKQEMREPKIKAFLPVWVCYARKGR